MEIESGIRHSRLVSSPTVVPVTIGVAIESSGDVRIA